MEIIAHRGASGYVLENSRQALELAWRQGADRVEIDVRATRDGKLLVLHDPTLNRTTTGQGPVSRFAWDELSPVRLKNGEPLLLLEEALDLVQGRIPVYLDVKDRAAVQGVGKLLAGHEEVIVGSSDPTSLRWVRDQLPGVSTSLLVKELDDPVGKAERAGANYVHLCWERELDPVPKVSAALVAKAEEAGIGVILWHEEREAVLMRIRGLPGVYGVCTNLPDRARRILAPPLALDEGAY